MSGLLILAKDLVRPEGTLDQSSMGLPSAYNFQNYVCLQRNQRIAANSIQSYYVPSIWTKFRYTLVLDPLASPFFDATNRKLRMQLSFNPAPPSTIGNMKVVTTSFSSFTMVRFFGARVAVWLVAPRRTRNTDEKEQRGEFHIHVAKLVTQTLQ